MTFYDNLSRIFRIAQSFSLAGMFKWRANDDPKTPKLSSVSLPPNSPPLASIAQSHRHSKPEKIARGFLDLDRYVPTRRSATPQVLPSQRKESLNGGHGASRLRTVSMSRVVEDDAVKPTKAASNITSEHMTADPTHLSKGGAKLEKSERRAGPLKSALKGGSSHLPTQKQDFPSDYIKPASRHNTYPPTSRSFNHLAADDFHHSRHENFSSHQPHASSLTPKYMKAHIKEVPLKDEAVTLSWPLVDYASRVHTRTPPLFFDIGFDPNIDEYAVRVNRGGHSTPLSRSECEIPVSPHMFITDMVIVCPKLDHWPIKVHRSKGLRCIDVFRAIYDTFAVPLTDKELSYVGDAYKQRCERAFKQRCIDSPGLPLYNERCGMRRVDLLRGRRIFKGIVRDPEGGSRWILNIEDL